ncbi:MAG: O-antigen ligase family protein [Anaerolineae bacterium]
MRYYLEQLPFVQYAKQILALELWWPVPLILVGVLRILEPLWVTVAIGLVLVPWVTRWLVLGRLTHPAIVGGTLALLGFSGLVGVWVSYDPNLSWPLCFTLLGSIALFFAIVNTHISSWRVSQGLVLAAFLIACYFVGQYDHFDYPLEVGRLADLGRTTGSLLPDLVFFTPHPNAVAGFLEGAVFLSGVLTQQGDKRKRIVWSLVLVLIAYGLLISGSRGAWVGLAVAGLIWVVWFRSGRSWQLGMAIIGLTVVLLAILVMTWFLPTLWSIPAVTSAIETAASRLTLYRNSLYLWSDYPYTGIGLGDTFALVYSHYQLLLHVPFLTYSHNLFLSVVLGLGVLGLISLVWLLVSFYTFVVQAEKFGLDQKCQALFRAALLGVTVIFIHGLTDSPQFAGSGWTMPMLFGLMGVAVVSGRQALAESQAWSIPKRILILLIIIVGIILIGFWQPLLSGWYVNLGALHQTQAELSPNLNDSARTQEIQLAIADFTYALKLNPEQPAAHRRLGLIAFRQEDYNTAIVYLEKAYQQEPDNQVTLKALGYAYMWTGRLTTAENLLRHLDNQAGLVHELDDWSGWLKSQGQTVLSTYAAKMAQQLTAQ